VIFSKANFETFSTSLAIQACGAVTGIVTARLLGPVARGQLATVILWPMVLSNLGLMGCNWTLAREVAKAPEHEPDWVLMAVATALGSALLYLLAGYFLVPLLLPADKSNLVPLARLCLLLIPLDILNQVLLAAEHGRMRWRRYNVLRLSFSLFYLFLIGVLGVTQQAKLLWFVAAFLASQLLAALLRIAIHGGALLSGKLRLGGCLHLLRAGVPFFGATISNLMWLQLDTILVVGLLNTEAAGLYAVAAAFANGQSALGDALGITSFGLLSNEMDRAGQRKIITETFRQSAMISFGVGLALACAIPFLVAPLFGSAFARAVWPAVVLALAASLGASTNILNQGLRGAGRPHAGLAIQLFGAAILALAALFYLRRFGLIGIAIAVLLSACVQLLALTAAAARWLRVPLLQFWPFDAKNVRALFRSAWEFCGPQIRNPLREPFV
jgi:O-antigen/teichoic acid export membrane protein